MLERGDNKEVTWFISNCASDYIIRISLNYTSHGWNLQYLPIEGLAAFNKATAELLFGAGHPVIKEQRVCLHLLFIMLLKCFLMMFLFLS